MTDSILKQEQDLEGFYLYVFELNEPIQIKKGGWGKPPIMKDNWVKRMTYPFRTKEGARKNYYFIRSQHDRHDIINAKLCFMPFTILEQEQEDSMSRNKK